LTQFPVQSPHNPLQILTIPQQLPDNQSSHLSHGTCGHLRPHDDYDSGVDVQCEDGTLRPRDGGDDLSVVSRDDGRLIPIKLCVDVSVGWLAVMEDDFR